MKSIIRTSILVDDATPFSLIEYLKLESLPKLEEIWDGPISSNSFRKLNTLKVTDSGIKQFWKSSSQNNYVPLFSNLSSIYIRECHRLCNLGQLSIAGKDCLPQLETLHIMFCSMMEQVFLWNDKETGENKGSIELRQNRHVITKVFPKLKEVSLYNLPNLTTFYQGIEGIEFPLLRVMSIYECPKMKNIIIGSNENSSRERTSSSADIDDDDSLHLFCQSEKVSFGSSLEVLAINHNPFCGHEIPSSLCNGLKELTISEYEGSMRLFTLSVAANLVSLRELHIASCVELIKVIEDEQQVVSGGERILLFPKLEMLWLSYLPKLVRFCEWKCVVELPSLTTVVIEMCPNMENLSLGLVAAPNLEAFTTDLTTYVGVGVDVAFNNLKKLEIIGNENPLYDDKISVSLFNGLEKLELFYCKGSMSLFSSSAVGNFVNLRVLRIEHCDEILVKVIEDEDGKVVSGGEIRIVVFPKLEELYLDDLPKLVSFCEWKCVVELPSLTTMEIERCPNMKNFSLGFVVAPKLKFVRIDYEEIGGTKHLNGAVQQHYLARREKENEKQEEDDQN